MKRRHALILSGLTIGLAVLWTVPAQAIKPFKDEFEATYVKPDSQAPADVALAAAVQAARCNICHEGKSKTQRNAYGAALDKLLDKAADAENKAKIHQAFQTVAALKSDPANPNSPTFGDRIRQGKLPCEGK